MTATDTIEGFRQAVADRYQTIASHRQPGQKVLVDEFSSTLATVARDVKIQRIGRVINSTC